MAAVNLVKVVSAIGDESVFINPDAIATVYSKKTATGDRASASIHMINGDKVMIDEDSYRVLSHGLAEMVGAETS